MARHSAAWTMPRLTRRWSGPDDRARLRPARRCSIGTRRRCRGVAAAPVRRRRGGSHRIARSVLAGAHGGGGYAGGPHRLWTGDGCRHFWAARRGHADRRRAQATPGTTGGAAVPGEADAPDIRTLWHHRSAVAG